MADRDKEKFHKEKLEKWADIKTNWKVIKDERRKFTPKLTKQTVATSMRSTEMPNFIWKNAQISNTPSMQRSTIHDEERTKMLHP